MWNTIAKSRVSGDGIHPARASGEGTHLDVKVEDIVVPEEFQKDRENWVYIGTCSTIPRIKCKWDMLDIVNASKICHGEHDIMFDVLWDKEIRFINSQAVARGIQECMMSRYDTEVNILSYFCSYYDIEFSLAPFGYVVRDYTWDHVYFIFYMGKDVYVYTPKCTSLEFVYICVRNMPHLLGQAFDGQEGSYLQQSGEFESKDFANSKYEKRISAAGKIQDTARKLEELLCKNVGSSKKNKKKKKNGIRTLRSKLREQAQYVPHAGYMDELKDFAKDPEKIAVMIEKMICAIAIMYRGETLVKIIGMFGLFARGSLFYTAYRALALIIEQNFSDVTLDDINEWLKQAVKDWKGFTTNAIAGKFWALVMSCFTFFMSPKCLEALSGSFFSKWAMGVYKGVFKGDLINTILSSAYYLCNAVKIFCTTGSLRGFLSTDGVYDDFVDRMLDLRTKAMLYQSGNLKMVDTSIPRFFQDMDDLQEELRASRDMFLPYQNKTLSYYEAELQSLRQAVYSEQVMRSRKMPFILGVFGSSGVRKTHFTRVCARIITEASGNVFEEDSFSLLDYRKKYHDGWKNSTLVVGLEDVANESPSVVNHGEVTFQDALIRLGGTEAYILPAAAVQLKNMLFFSGVGVIFNTNNESLNLYANTNYVSTGMRRIHLKVNVRIKDQYRSVDADGNPSSMADNSKIPPEMSRDPFPDIWSIDAYKCEIKARQGDSAIKNDYMLPSSTNRMDDFWKWTLIEKDMSLRDFLCLLDQHVVEHFDRQNAASEVVESIRNEDSCEECGRCRIVCTCFKDYVSVSSSEEVDVSLSGYTATVVEDDTSVFGWRSVQVQNDPPPSKPDPPEVRSYEPHAGENLRVYMKVVDRILKTKPVSLRVYNDLLTGISEGYDALLHLERLVSTFFTKSLADIVCRVVRKYLTINNMEYVLRPSYWIPASVEGTVLGQYLHSQRGDVKLAAFLDGCRGCSGQPPIFSKMVCDGVHPLKVLMGYKPGEQGLLGGNLACPFLDFENVMRITVTGFGFRDRIKELVKDTSAKLTSSEAIRKSKDPNSLRDIAVPLMSLWIVIKKVAPSVYADVMQIFETSYDPHVGAADDLKKADATWNHRELYEMRTTEALGLSSTSLTTPRPTANLSKLISNNLFFVYDVNKTEYVCGFAMCSKVMLLPTHFVRRYVGQQLVFCRYPSQGIAFPVNATFTAYVSDSDCIHLQGQDITAAILPSLGTARDIRTNLYDNEVTYFGAWCGRLYTKNIECAVVETDVSSMKFNPALSNDPTSHSRNMKGYEYLGTCRKGMCMSPLVDRNTSNGKILGFHIGGTKDEKAGIASTFTTRDYDSIVESMKQHEVRCVPQCGGFLGNMEKYGVNLYDDYVPDKSAMRNSSARIIAMGSYKKRVRVKPSFSFTTFGEEYGKLKKCSVACAPVLGPSGVDVQYAISSLLERFSKPRAVIDPIALNWAFEDYLSGVMCQLEKDAELWREEIRPLRGLTEILIGIPGKKFVNPVNLSTAVCPELGGKKRDYVSIKGDKRYLDPKVYDQYRKCRYLSRKGHRFHSLWAAYPKVEVVPQEKVDAGKVRVFYACDFATQLLVREMYLTLGRFFYTQRYASECAVGINPHGTSWNESLEHLMRIKGERYIASDFKNFDLTIPAELALKCHAVLMKVLEWSGNYNEEDIMQCCVLRDEMMDGIVTMNGDMWMVNGTILSGTNLTSILGSIANSLLHRVAFHQVYKDDKSKLSKGFRHGISLLTFGDDSIGKVSRECGEFTVSRIMDELRTFGFEVTNCWKDERIVTFMKLQNVDFLKRAYVYMEDFGMYVGRLTEKSIHKMLIGVIPSKVVHIDRITAQNVDAALMEWRYYGRRRYEKERKILIDLCKKYNILDMCNFIQYSYDDMLVAWRMMNGLEGDQEESSGLILKIREWVENFLTKSAPGYQGEASEDSFPSGDADMCPHQHDCVSIQKENENKKDSCTLQESIIPEGHGPSSVGETLNLLQVGGAYHPQSGEGPDVNIEVPPPTTFLNEENQGIVRRPDDPGIRIERDPYGEAKALLERPILIMTIPWGGDFPAVFSSFNPMNLVLTDPVVSARMSKLAIYKCKLHLKFVINGGPFFSGRLIAAFKPFGWTGADSVRTMTNTDIYNGLNPMGSSVLSCLPHIILDPCTSRGGELILPYIENTSSAVISSPGYIKSVHGILYMCTINKLRSVNETIESATSSITVQVYGWLEDLEMRGHTRLNANPNNPQSGVMSKTLSKAANVSDAIGNLAPAIKPLTTSASMAARMGSQIADLLGYCREKKPSTVAYNSLSTARTHLDGVEELGRLSLYKDHEKTISDPSGFSGEDCLTIDHMCTREAYIGTALWQYDTFSGESLMYLSPNLYWLGAVKASAGTGGNPVLWMPPGTGVAQMFNYYTGTMRLRFEVVCSAFHKGRILFVYDPYAAHTSAPKNTAYQVVMDLSETNTVSLDIGVNNERGFIGEGPAASYERSKNQSRTLLNVTSSPIETVVPSTIRDNGCISAFVLTKLSVPKVYPGVDQHVDINVYMSMLPGTKFYEPRPVGTDFIYESHSASFVDNIDVDNDDASVRFGEASVPLATTLSFNETVESLRAYIKRPSVYLNIVVGNGDFKPWLAVFDAYPRIRGRTLGTGDSLHTTAAFGDMDVVNNSPISYLRPAFLGMTGGIRWYFNIDPLTRPSGAIEPGYGIIHNLPPLFDGAGMKSTLVPLNTADNLALLSTMQSFVSSSGASFLPAADYNKHRIAVETNGYHQKTYVPSSYIGAPDASCRFGLYRSPSTGNDLVRVEVAAADDFSLFGFLGFPPLTVNIFSSVALTSSVYNV